MTVKKIILFPFVIILAIIGITELAFWLGETDKDNLIVVNPCVVLILGYPSNADGSPHPVQALRVRAGVSAYKDQQCSKMIISGGAVRSNFVQAVTMAKLAQQQGIPAKQIVIEDKARNTWENIGCATPELKGFKRILIASDSLHSHRGKRYLCRQNSSLCDITYTTGGYEPLTLLSWKIPAAVNEFKAWVRDVVIYENNNENNSAFCPE